MSKPQFGSIYQRGSVYWIKYYRDGKAFYESSKSRRKKDAERLLDRRRAEIATGTHLDNDVRRLKIGELLDDLVLDYKINGQDHGWAELVVRKHLRPYFGAMAAVKLSRDTVKRYIDRRQEAGAANATINKALALLHRSYTLAVDAGKLTLVPPFPRKLAERNVRKGFFEWEDYTAVRSNLPAEIKPVIAFAYWTGCRKGEILKLKWTQVDLANRMVRLEPGETKNDEPRLIPLTEDLFQLLAMNKSIRDERWPDCPWVFSRQGKRIKDFRKSWEKACAAAGLADEGGKPEKLFHDLRRTGVRNLVRAGVPERVAMAISGHKTRSVFDRYNIVSEKDLHEAARKLDRYLEKQDSGAVGDTVVTVEVTQKTTTARKLLN